VRVRGGRLGRAAVAVAVVRREIVRTEMMRMMLLSSRGNMKLTARPCPASSSCRRERNSQRLLQPRGHPSLELPKSGGVRAGVEFFRHGAGEDFVRIGWDGGTARGMGWRLGLTGWQAFFGWWWWRSGRGRRGRRRWRVRPGPRGRARSRADRGCQGVCVG
jgi:hypothetical protein